MEETLVGFDQDLFFEGIKENWIQYLGPVINQMNCANCWAVSFVEVLTGIANKYLPAGVKEIYAA